MNKSIEKIFFPWTLIVISFLLASLWFDKKSILLFDTIWRITTIAGVYIWGNIRFSFSLKQWVTLCLLFILGFGAIRVFSSSQSTLPIVLNIALTPFSEEIFFRGWVISKIDGNNKNKIIYSSLFFSLYHLKNMFILTPLALLYQLLYSGIVVGPVFGWVKLRYNSLFPSIALHGVNNMIALTITEKFFPVIGKKNFKFGS